MRKPRTNSEVRRKFTSPWREPRNIRSLNQKQTWPCVTVLSDAQRLKKSLDCEDETECFKTRK